MSLFTDVAQLRQRFHEDIHRLESLIHKVEDDIERDVARIEKLLVSSLPSSSLTFGWGGATKSYRITPQNGKATIIMSDATFTDSSAGDSATLSLTDAAGLAITPTTAPVWTASDAGSIITLTVAADGLSATAVPASPPQEGVSTVTITFTNPDGTAVTATSTVTVTAGSDATSMSVTWSPIQASTDSSGGTAAPASS